MKWDSTVAHSRQKVWVLFKPAQIKYKAKTTSVTFCAIVHFVLIGTFLAITPFVAIETFVTCGIFVAIRTFVAIGQLMTSDFMVGLGV